GDIEHGFLLNVEALHVPLIVSRPGTVDEGRRVEAIASLVDVLPTILDHVGIAGPPTTDGRTLGPALRGGELSSVPSYAETELPLAQFGWSPLRSLTTPEWHYVRTARPELYDRAGDPAERTNPAPVREGDVRR